MGSIKKLKTTEIKAYRENMLEKQQGICPLCETRITEKACLDHAHMEPHKDRVRGVLHNHCNIFLGKLENARVRTGTSWEDFFHFHPAAWGYIHNAHHETKDWHPSKRKSEVIEFKKLSADDQKNHLLVKGVNPEDPKMKNQSGRVGLFKKLSAMA